MVRGVPFIPNLPLFEVGGSSWGRWAWISFGHNHDNHLHVVIVVIVVIVVVHVIFLQFLKSSFNNHFSLPCFIQ